MSFGDALQAIIVCFIGIGFFVVAWRGGARNPVSTGGLDKRLTVFSSELRGMREKVDEIEDRVEEIELKAATSNDINRLEVQLKDHVRQTAQLRVEVTTITERISGNREGIDKIAQSLADLESRQRAINEKMSDLQSEGASRAEAIKHVASQMDRLMSVIVERGVTN